MKIVQLNYTNYAIKLCILCNTIIEIMQLNYENYAIYVI